MLARNFNISVEVPCWTYSSCSRVSISITVEYLAITGEYLAITVEYLAITVEYQLG